jgi:hypothetical protein
MTPQRIELIPARAFEDWSRWLEPVAHDFYHTAAYHRFAEESGEGEAFLAVCGSPDRFVAWPYLLRPAGRWRDVTSVYGYCGPLTHHCSTDLGFLRNAWECIHNVWRSQRVVSVFTRFHPLLENHLAAPASLAGGATVSIDLTAPESSNWHDYQASLRNRIHRGRRLGLVSEIDHSWSHLDDFARFYHAAMRRNSAAPYYFFSTDYFRRLRQALGHHIVLMLTRQGNAIAAAGLFIEYRGIVQNHFCVNNESYARLAPSKVLLDDVRCWARGRGNRVFHLGGGRGATADSLFAFKAAFSRRRHPFFTGRWVLDSGAYLSLCRGLPSQAATQGFFPAYRSPDFAPQESSHV